MKQSVILEGWRFVIDQDDLGEQEGWYLDEFNRSAWMAVKVPGAWDYYDHALRNYEGTAWYSCVLGADLVQSEMLQTLHFQSVSGHSKVWINGVLLGENIGRYLPFEFPINRFLRKGSNTIVLRVDNEHRKEWLPGGPLVEWVHYGGILQPVTLVSKNQFHIRDLCIRTEPDKFNGANVYIDAVLLNDGTETQQADITVSINADGEVHSRIQQVSCPSHAESSIKIHLNIANLARWDLEHPILHQVHLQLDVDGTTVDTMEDHFGFRTFTISNHQFFLNNKPIPIHGVNRYDEYDPFGVTVPEEVIREDLIKMKQAGVNFVRVHYPQDPVHLKLMDEIGILFLEEVPINWWRVDPNQSESAAKVLEAAEKALEEMVRRDKNHPCLVAWSMANESDTDTEIGIVGMRRLIRKTRILDPTRLVTFVVHTDTKGHDAFEEADFIGINLYFGLFQGELATSINQLDELVRDKTQQRLEEIAEQYPDKPLVMTEFGTHGIKGQFGKNRMTETYQSEYIKAVWQAIQAVPSVQGGILWCWADYYHQRDFIGRDDRMLHSVYGPYGVVTVDRKEKSTLATLTQLFNGIK